MYAVRAEGLLRDIQELVMHFIVTCDDEASVTAAKPVTYREEMNVAVVFFLS